MKTVDSNLKRAHKSEKIGRDLERLWNYAEKLRQIVNVDFKEEIEKESKE